MFSPCPVLAADQKAIINLNMRIFIQISSARTLTEKDEINMKKADDILLNT